MPLPRLKPQEIPFDDPDSKYRFEASPEKPFVATPAAITMYTEQTIVACWNVLRHIAQQEQGIDYLQVFESDDHSENLWFIEDDDGGAINALLPSDY